MNTITITDNGHIDNLWDNWMNHKRKNNTNAVDNLCHYLRGTNLEWCGNRTYNTKPKHIENHCSASLAIEMDQYTISAEKHLYNPDPHLVLFSEADRLVLLKRYTDFVCEALGIEQS